MLKLTKKYIFECKLKGIPVEFNTGVLYHVDILALLVETGVWEKDKPHRDNVYREYRFRILYPIKMRDSDFANYPEYTQLDVGDYHTVCL